MKNFIDGFIQTTLILGGIVLLLVLTKDLVLTLALIAIIMLIISLI